MASVSARRRSRRGHQTTTWTNWLNWPGWLLTAATLGVLVLAVGPRLGTFLIVSDPPAPADATFLTYGVAIRRPALDAAIQRYQSGEGPRILVSALVSRDADYYVVPHSSELVRQYLLDRSVPADAVEVLDSVESEVDEAQRLRAAIAARGWHRVVAYAPDFRARRTAGTLKRIIAPTGVDLRVVAVRDPEVQLERWWTTRPGIDVIYNEYPKLAYYALRGRL